jgi:glycosyltransferase involved in cell wall biosynthesis
MKFNILYIANIRLPSQRANSIQIINTCQALAERGNKIYLLVRKMGLAGRNEILKYYGLADKSNLQIIKLPVYNGKNVFLHRTTFLIMVFIYSFLFFLIKKIDIVYTREPSKAMILNPLKTIFKFKLVFEVHDLNEKELFAKKNTRKLFDALVVISEYMRKYFSKSLAENKPIVLARDAVSKKLIKQQVGPKNKKIIYMGQLYQWKGVDTLIKGMPLVRPPAELTIVGGIAGEPDMARLKELARHLEVNKRIIFKGYLPHWQSLKELDRSAIAVLTLDNKFEVAEYCTSPMKLFEYMARGLAIVAPDVSAIREIIKNNVNGILYKCNNEKSLAAAINRLLADDALRKKIAQGALLSAKNYTWEKRAVLLDATLASLKG